MHDDPHHDRVRRATQFLLTQCRLLATLFPPDPERSAASALLLLADALGNVVASYYRDFAATDTEVAKTWLAECVRILEAHIQGEVDPAFVLDLAELRRIQREVLDWGNSMGGLSVPDALPEDLT